MKFSSIKQSFKFLLFESILSLNMFGKFEKVIVMLKFLKCCNRSELCLAFDLKKECLKSIVDLSSILEWLEGENLILVNEFWRYLKFYNSY